MANELASLADEIGAAAPFDRLSPAQRLTLCRRAKVFYLRAGVRLQGYAEDGDLLLVRSGALAMDRGEGRAADQRSEGEAVLIAAIETASAAEDTLLMRFPGATIEAMREEAPGFDGFLAGSAESRVRDGIEHGFRGHDLAGVTVDSVMSSPVICIDGSRTIVEAASVMAERNVSAIIIQSQGGAGILTDRDLRKRVVGAGRSASEPCASVMTPKLITTSPKATLVDAILTMAERGLHHLAVAVGDELVGMITASDVFRARNSQPIYLSRDIERAKDAASAITAGARRDRLFGHLVAQGAQPTHVGRFVTGVTDALTRRLIELAIDELGDPPCDFAWVAFGSQARREQSLKSDQDNGLVLAESPSENIDSYFAQLAKRVCNGLNEAGLSYCPGNVMASNANWRRDVETWQSQFQRWIEAPEPYALMEASIFFDCRSVYGEASLVGQIQGYIAKAASSNQIFLRFMAQNVLSLTPPLGLFRRFVLERDGAQSEGLHLKKRGIMPVVGLARLRALELGLSVPGTEERLTAAAEAKPSDAADLANLRDALSLIAWLRQEAQRDQLRAGEEVSHFLDPDALNAMRREHLRSAFEVVRTAQRALARRYALG